MMGLRAVVEVVELSKGQLVRNLREQMDVSHVVLEVVAETRSRLTR